VLAQSTPADPQPQAPHRTGAARAADVGAARAHRAQGQSLRQCARALNRSKSALARALQRGDALDTDPAARAFFDATCGQDQVHRLVVALLLVLVFRAGLGVGLVRQVLVLAGLSRRVACSASHLRTQVGTMRRLLLTFAQQETARLAATMPHRVIVLTPDEMFRAGAMILTAPDPVSGMVLVHGLATQRDAVTWEEAVRTGLVGLNVTLASLCGDGSTALALAAERLNVPYSPELFHATHALAAAFDRPVRAEQATARKRHDKAAGAALCHRVQAAAVPGPPAPAHVAAEATRAAAQATLAATAADLTTVREVRETLARVLHPVDLHTGALRDPAEVATVVADQLHRLDPLAARLGGKARTTLATLRDMIPAWTALVADWQRRVLARVAHAAPSLPLAALLWTQLIPACYLAWVSARNHLPTAVRTDLRAQSAARLAAVAAQAEWGALPPALRRHLLAVAEECARWFVRCSSATEGHHAWTARHLFRHHGVRAEWLDALKVVHNFLLERADGTTAAQRFFGQPHGDLLAFLCAGMPRPALPRQRQRRPRPDPLGLQP
jgi:hypothetical protein